LRRKEMVRLEGTLLLGTAGKKKRMRGSQPCFNTAFSINWEEGLSFGKRINPDYIRKLLSVA